MTAEIVERVRRSRRYRDVDVPFLERLAAEELPRSRNADDAVKRVKRRLHQAVGAFRAAGPSEIPWPVHDAAALRETCLALMRGHASTRERLAHLEVFHAAIWEHTGVPSSVLDLGCGLHPLSLPWMRLPGVRYVAVDVDEGALRTVASFLAAMEQPHAVTTRDLALGPPPEEADVALALKLVTTLDRQDPLAAARLLDGVQARHAVVSFTRRSLAGRGRGMERTYRDRLERLVTGVPRVRDVHEASAPNELVFVLSLDPARG